MGLIRRLRLIIALGCLMFASNWFPSQAQSAGAPIEGSDGEWYVEAPESTGDARIAEFLGRKALWLKNGRHIIRSGIEFADGTIEFDVAPMDRANFVGILFRREAFQNQENVYLRIHRSGLYNAVQYAPRMNGSSTWQLYPEFNAIGQLPRNQWTHVRLEVRGPQLEVFLNNGPQPVLTVPRLRGLPKKGTVAFWGRVNEQPTIWAAALSNISIRPATTTTTATAPRPAPPAGTLTQWKVAGPFTADQAAIISLPELKNWRDAQAEESGLINLNRLLKSGRGRFTAFAATTVNSEAARTAVLELGYSDDVSVFLNGELIYSGVNGFESRHPEYMGFVKSEYERISLKLRRGNNKLVLALTDDQRFGWGFIARLK